MERHAMRERKRVRERERERERKRERIGDRTIHCIFFPNSIFKLSLLFCHTNKAQRIEKGIEREEEREENRERDREV